MKKRQTKKDFYRKSRKIFEVSLIMMTIMFGYNNCGQQFKTEQNMPSSSLSSGSNGLGLTGDLCEDQILTLYASGYKPFVEQNCALCHSNGPGKGRFANSDLLTAFNDFNQIGYTKVSDNAISVNHNPPNSGPQHTQRINELRLEWQKGQQEYNTCKGTTATPVAQNIEDVITLETTSQVIPSLIMSETKMVNGVPTVIRDEKQIVWNDLQSQLTIIKSRVPQVPVISSALNKAKFGILVAKNRTSGGETYYTFRSPTLFDASTDLRVKGIHVKINGRLQKYPTTFKFIDTGVFALTKNDISGVISTGSLIIPGIFFPEDRVSFVFELIEPTVLPLPTLPPLVSIGTASYRTVGLKKYLDIPINLSKSVASPETVSLIIDQTPLCGAATAETVVTVNGTTCAPALFTQMCGSSACTAEDTKFSRARSIVGASYNRYDWDYRVLNNSTTFTPGELTKVITIELSSDLRKEANRALTVQLDKFSSGLTLGTTTTMTEVLVKSKNPNPSVYSFSVMMNPSTGVLGKNCVACHNSRDRSGNYDMTSYEDMINKGVLIPGNVASKMYRRMDKNDPNLENLTAMPLSGYLPSLEANAVKNWILFGAKND